MAGTFSLSEPTIDPPPPGPNTGLSRHGDPVFPHFCPLNQHLARVRTRGAGGGGKGVLDVFSGLP